MKNTAPDSDDSHIEITDGGSKMSGYQKVDIGNAKWVSPGGKTKYPLMRTVVTLPEVKSAKVTIAGLGIYEMHINEKRVGEDLFLPLSTDFHERWDKLYYFKPFDEITRHRLYCPVYDITNLLIEGENAICLMMGPGWYEVPDECWHYGNIKICYFIEYTDMDDQKHTITSDETLKWKEGFVTEGTLHRGESHDYRDYDDSWMSVSYDDTGWEPVIIEEAPETKLYEQDSPADKVIRRVCPKLIREENGVRLYDVGEMITGYPIFTSDAPAGEQIKVRYGEILNEEGWLCEDHTYRQHSNFITDGTNRRMHCYFTWLCFKYFEVTGDAKLEDCLVIHSDVAVTSSFESSSPALNWLNQAYIRTQLDNMHCGIPSDCPHDERRGYTGDGQLTCSAAMMQLDAQKFYKKWIYDIADCQDSITGHMQNTAPYLPSGGGPGGWGCAIVVVPYMYYKFYGDAGLFEELYPQMLHWYSSLEDHSENDLITTDKPGRWCLGDWCLPTMGFVNDMSGILIPAPLVNTYFYIKSMEMMLEMNKVLNTHENDTFLLRRIETKKNAIVAEYYDPATGDFAKNLQGSNAFAVDLGLGDERTFENMAAHYELLKKYDTGIFATDILTRLFFENGREDLAIGLLTSVV